MSPPYDQETETRVLSACFNDPRLVYEARLRTDDFYDPRHQLVWSAAQTAASQGLPVPLVIAEVMERAGTLAPAGGREFLAYLKRQFATKVGFDRFCAKLRGLTLRRRLIDAGTRIVEAGHDDQCVPSEYATLAEKAILDATQDVRTTTGLEDIAVVAQRVLDAAKERMDSGVPPCAPIGLADVDSILRGGLYRDDLVLVGARPSMGKSAFGIQVGRGVARHCAEQGDGCVAVFSVESSEDSLVKRIFKGDTGRDEHGGILEPQAYEAWRRCAETLPPGRLFVDFRAGITVLDVASECRRLHARTPVRCVVIDYLQFLVPHSPRLPREQQVREMSMACKALAKELHCPVVVLSQLNRSLESRPDKRPQLSDLRESGALEQDADVVVFLYRDDYYHPDSEDAGVAEVIVAKQRDGATGTVCLAWDPKRVRFANLERRREAPPQLQPAPRTWADDF